MSCRPPQILTTPYMKTGVPSNQTDRYVLDSYVATEAIAAIEIDCSSEVDCCIVSHSGGDAFVSVGSPAVGPFIGQLLVKPWRRVMPFSNDGQGYSATPLVLYPPRLALKLHFDMPSVFQTRRAPVFRSADDSNALGVGYTTVAELPLFGFASARLSFSNGGSTSLTYRIKGKMYRAKLVPAEQSDDPVGWNASTYSADLSLNGSGSLELTVATLVTVSVTFVGEPWDTLQLEAKLSGAAGALVSGISYQANGEI